jgi:hypothetical protein
MAKAQAARHPMAEPPVKRPRGRPRKNQAMPVAARGSGSPASRKIIYKRPWLYPKQLAAIYDCVDKDGLPARYAMIEASTKAGKTVGCMSWLFEQAAIHGKDGRNYWWVAPVYGQAKIAFRRMKRGLPKSLFVANETELTIRLINGAVLWFKSGEKPDNLYGEDVHAAVLDEASRVREDSFVALRSTLTATRGPLRCIGNVKGRRNWFYKLCRKAEQGAAGMAYAKLNAYDAIAGGVLEAKEIEDAKALLPENVFRELYLAEASDDEGNPFGFTHIAACATASGGRLAEAEPVAAGADLAKSVDWTVVIGLDRLMRVCGFERWQSGWDQTEDRILSLVGNIPALIDSTGVGDPIVERLKKKRRKIDGYHFSSASKQRLMEGLAVAIQRHELQIPDGPIRAELENFEYVYTRTGVRYSAPEGYHDDCVMALALAVEMHRRIAPYLVNVNPAGAPRVSPWLGVGNHDHEGEQ